MEADNDLRAELQAALNGLIWMSESDSPLTLIWWPGERTQEAMPLSPQVLLARAALPPETPVKTLTPAALFRSQIGNDAPNDARFRNLLALLERATHNLTAFRAGEIQIHVFVLGATATGAIVGFRTLAIET